MRSTRKWRRRILYVLCTGTVFGGLLLGIYCSTQHVPRFYREALQDINVTAESAAEFEVRTTELLERIDANPDWTESFTEQQINSWLAYEFPDLDQDLIPEEVSDPRVRFRNGTILAACRYEGEEFSGVLSFEIIPKVTETHELALELTSLKAGLIPLPLRRIVDELSQTRDLQGWDVELLEVEDGEVLVVSHPLAGVNEPELTTIQVDQELITLSGRSRPPEQTRLSRLLDQSETSSESSN